MKALKAAVVALLAAIALSFATLQATFLIAWVFGGGDGGPQSTWDYCLNYAAIIVPILVFFGAFVYFLHERMSQ